MFTVLYISSVKLYGMKQYMFDTVMFKKPLNWNTPDVNESVIGSDISAEDKIIA